MYTLAPAKAEGIGGWLWFYALNFIGLLWQVAYATWLVTWRGVSELPSPWIVAALIYSVLLFLFIVFVAVRFLQRRTIARWLNLSLWPLSLAFWIISMSVWTSIGHSLLGGPHFFDTEEYLGNRLLISIAQCLVWIPYFLVSKRVKRTFVL